MSHLVTYNPDSGLIETKIQGNLSLDEAKQLIAEIGTAAKDNHCFRCLSDYRETTMRLSTIEIYDIPQLLSRKLASMGIDAQKFKRAIVVAKSLEDFHFFETVTINTGQNIRLFLDMEEARKWLLEP